MPEFELAKAAIAQSIIDDLPDGVIEIDMSGKVRAINEAAKRLLGADLAHAEEALILRADGLPFEPEQRPSWLALQGQTVRGVLVQLARQADRPVWVSVNGRPLYRQGRVIGAVFMMRDVTLNLQREAELAGQALRLQEQASLLDLSRDAILVRNMQDEIRFWNAGAERLYGYSKQEAIGQVSHVLLKTELPESMDQIRAALERERYWAGEIVHVTRDGRRLAVFSQWVLEYENGQPVRYLETNTNITAGRQAERALREVEENYRLVVEAAVGVAIITADAYGCIRTWNSGARAITGLSEEEVLGQSLERIFKPLEHNARTLPQEMREARERGRSEDNCWYLRADGSRYWASGVTMPLRNEDDELRGYVKILRDQTNQRLRDEEAHFLAHHDALTGLANRVYLSNEVHRLIAAARRTDVPIGLMILDLDKFKQVNDKHGHEAGDQLLRQVADRISSSLRENDFAARLGGDEFVVVQTEVKQPRAAETLARKLVDTLGKPYEIDGVQIASGTSIGIAVYPDDGKDVVELLKKADLALYRAKHAGRGTYRFYSPAFIGLESRQASLQKALRDGEFRLYYQPAIDLQTWQVQSVEALLRWNVSGDDVAMPDKFLAFAEESGLMIDIGDWALYEACRQVKAWQDAGLPIQRVNVNLSPSQVRDPRLVERVERVLAASSLAATCLEVEIQENLLTEELGARERIRALRALGVRIAADNFGTGSTPIVQMRDLEIDAIKIAREFIEHLPHRAKEALIIASVIELGRALNINVSAGGVETAEQLSYLRARSCDTAQGFLFSAPLPAEQLERLVREGAWHMGSNMSSKEARQLH